VKLVQQEIQGLPQPLPDISFDNVQELIVWAEQVQYTPGLVHGDKRKAAGIELIRRGIEVLKGHVSCPRDMKQPLKTYTPQGA